MSVDRFVQVYKADNDINSFEAYVPLSFRSMTILTISLQSLPRLSL